MEKPEHFGKRLRELCIRQNLAQLQLAEELTVLNPHTNIVFLTGRPEYTGEALNLYCN